ncbi:unnamed protein product [Rhizophagus irregularis]|uniref:Restriction endonuclease domain-containing protein n=1 Tax=Rhizophagus irregularis TaxID=588596 RepID=A0A2I1GDV7_9GLOM|nr:hypothetical protein RhiirA4_459200 [Rhizophagus irregularis]CAB4417523.1 unnamed protein product [Rhizophagus irregularis]CAB4417884.1 unnamed protein product [Rhizophagus irregularis]
MPPKKKINLKNLDLTHIYTQEEIEYINKHLKTHINFKNGRLLPISQSPIANEAIVHEISRQLGGYNFSVSGQKKIRAPHIAFIPENIYRSLNKVQLLTFLGQPFTPIFVAEVVNISKKAIFNEVDNRFKNDYFATGTSEDLDGGNILPDFTLDIKFVEKIISQKRNHNLLYTPRQRGIGGTMFLITKGDGANSYEGIDLSSPDICKRE